MTDGSDTHATIFISYARTDSDTMQKLSSTLLAAGFRVLFDTAEIGPAEIWRKRLADLIRQCDSVVFLISPRSVRSPDCEWELDEAERHAKRLFPVRICETPDAHIPGRLLQLHHVMAYPYGRLEPAMEQLVQALRIDLSWLREHTTLEELAQRWVDSGEAASRLLSGADIGAAEQWRDQRPRNAPDLTEHQRLFISASRRNMEVAERRRTTFASFAAIVAILIALGTNELRIAAGLSAFEARVTAEATSVIESLNTQNEALALRRALHAYSAASQTLEQPPDVVWNALRLAYAQYRTEHVATTASTMLALTMPSDDSLLALDIHGSLWSYEPTLDPPSPVVIERGLDGAQSHGISPSQRSIWARRGNVIRFHDLTGRLIPLPGDLKAEVHTLFDAAPDCIANEQSGHVVVSQVGDQKHVTALDIDWPSQSAGELRALRVSDACERFLLVGESAAFLYQKEGALWRSKKFEASSGEVWSASPSLRFIARYSSYSREIRRYDADSDDLEYFPPDLSVQRDSARSIHGADEVLVNNQGAFVARFGSEMAVFDADGGLRLQSAGNILPRILALSPSGNRLAVYRTSEKMIAFMHAGQTPLFETVLKDVGLPPKESIGALKICGNELVVGGLEGGVVVFDQRNLSSISRRYDARELVRRIDCDSGGVAMIASDHGVLDVRNSQANWLPEKFDAITSYGGPAIFPDSDNGLVVVSRNAVSRYSQDGAILETIERAPREDDTIILGGNALMLSEPRRLLLLGESRKERNGRFGARACAYLWQDGKLPRTVCRAQPQAIRFSAGGFLDDTTIVGAGLGGYLSLMPLSEEPQIDLEGAPQIIPHSIVGVGEVRFALSSLGGEIQIWARSGTLLQPSLSLSNTHGSLAIAADPETGEVLVGSGRAILRTVLSGPRLQKSSCDALARTERLAKESLDFCGADRHRSSILLRVDSIPKFEPLN